ncbi:Protein phosphatase PTC7 [Podila verticillata]|nr:Protein phosphatase PTC7 [Podila verticillata]
MLGRNAVRPFGMTPTRLMAVYSTAASQRITHWITKPFALVHMQRYISVAPQLLLTSSNSSSHSSSHSAARALSTTHIESLHTASVQQQQYQQHQAQPSLHDQEAPQKSVPESSSTSSPSSNGSTATSSPSGVTFNYLLAASWHPKSRQRKSYAMTTNASNSDEEDKTMWWKQKLRIGKVDAGEDAFFHVSTPSRVALGVADGVGGWSEVGVDPALFSWALMDNAEAVARQTDVDSGSDNKDVENKVLDAQTILDGAYSELVKGGKVEAGSSTACILSLCKLTGTLRASNLGDSAYLLIRNNRCIYESPSQQHFWNCPYQLTVLPPGYPGAGAYVMDMPKDAAQTTHQLQDGDVIVLATDGFWDNVFTKEAIELVDRELGDVIMSKDISSSVEDVVGRVRALSQRLTNTARRFSLDQKRLTPFSQGARHIRAGGKIDDITVIVTLVRAMAQQDPSTEKQV